MLHSHLPYYRKAGMWPFGEENVFECMAETYIPLLDCVARLWDDGIAAKLTIGLTPILVEQLDDEHMKQGFETYIEGRLHAAMEDEKRYAPRGETPDVERHRLARFYKDWFQNSLDSFRNKWNRDLIGAFKKYQDLGAIELTTSAATHCFSPLLAQDSSLRAQFRSGAQAYKNHFDREPNGVWLPECAYRPKQDGRPGIGQWLHDAGLKYFFTESFVIEGGESTEVRRVFGPYGTIEYIPVKGRPETGYDTFEAYWLKEYPVAVMGRHEEAGYQVWSADHGYPGDGNYREFHKKDDVSGLHYWKLTSKTTDLGDKEIYNPEAAQSRIGENSDHYVGVIQGCLTNRLKQTGKQGLVMVSFDTELFGHWWFEGISFIEQVIRKLKKYTNVSMTTATEYLEAHPPEHAIELPASSWGSGGHWHVWLNEETEWMWPEIHRTETTIKELAQKYDATTDAVINRALKQLAREVFLLQSSDWPFLVTTGQAKQYAVERFNQHVERFDIIADMLKEGRIDEKRLEEIESIDNCFPDVDPSLFKSVDKEVAAGTSGS